MADLSVLSICSGVGGLELGVRLAVPGSRVVGYVERDAYAAAVLLARMEDTTLEPAPVWCGDLADMDPAPFLGVDVISGGIPCQPFSAAGQRRGLDDERWLWPTVARLVSDVRPRFVYLENVPAFVTHGLPTVLADLATLGFDAEWLLLRASDVGAPHKRERFYLLAHADGTTGPRRPRDTAGGEGGLRAQHDHDIAAVREDVADASGPGREGRQ